MIHNVAGSHLIHSLKTHKIPGDQCRKCIACRLPSCDPQKLLAHKLWCTKSQLQSMTFLISTEEKPCFKYWKATSRPCRTGEGLMQPPSSISPSQKGSGDSLLLTLPILKGLPLEGSPAVLLALSTVNCVRSNFPLFLIIDNSGGPS